jgi:hypothetical protein
MEIFQATKGVGFDPVTLLELSLIAIAKNPADAEINPIGKRLFLGGGRGRGRRDCFPGLESRGVESGGAEEHDSHAPHRFQADWKGRNFHDEILLLKAQ